MYKRQEQAPAGELFRDPKHPYTIGLLNAIPVITKDRKPLSTIEGMEMCIRDSRTACY